MPEVTGRKTNLMLDLIRQHGVVTRADLRDSCDVAASNIDRLLAPHIDAGTVVIERGTTTGSPFGRPRRLYRWNTACKAPKKAKKMGPCLGGCGTQIVRDGITFMCYDCRRAAATASPYAP